MVGESVHQRGILTCFFKIWVAQSSGQKETRGCSVISIIGSSKLKQRALLGLSLGRASGLNSES